MSQISYCNAFETHAQGRLMDCYRKLKAKMANKRP